MAATVYNKIFVFAAKVLCSPDPVTGNVYHKGFSFQEHICKHCIILYMYPSILSIAFFFGVRYTVFSS